MDPLAYIVFGIFILLVVAAIILPKLFDDSSGQPID